MGEGEQRGLCFISSSQSRQSDLWGIYWGKTVRCRAQKGRAHISQVTRWARWSQIVRQAVKIIEQGDGIECVGVGGVAHGESDILFELKCEL